MEEGEERVQAFVAAFLLSVCLAEVAGRRPTGTWITSGQDQDDAVKTRMRIIHLHASWPLTNSFWVVMRAYYT